jgi:uncharacterized protein (DUF433 family)
MRDDERIAHYIELNPQKPGLQNARLKEYGVPIWALIGYLQQAVEGDIDRVAADYKLPREAVEAALAFYHRFPEYIDARLDDRTDDLFQAA